MRTKPDRKPRDYSPTFAPFDAANVRAAAAAILKLVGPDPDGPRHRHDLLEALGAFCKLPGCERPRRGLGFCAKHYRQHRRTDASEAHLINYAARRKATP